MDREKLKEAVERLEMHLSELYAIDTPFDKDIRTVLDALAQPQWKAIESDGLPKESGEYLVTARWKDEGALWYVAEVYFYPDDGWEQETTLSEREIIAWMSMPQPYQPEGK